MVKEHVCCHQDGTSKSEERRREVQVGNDNYCGNCGGHRDSCCEEADRLDTALATLREENERLAEMMVENSTECAKVRADNTRLRRELEEAREGLRKATDAYLDGRKRSDTRAETAEAALRGLLLSADCEWENQRLGHDWHEACVEARAALGGE